MISNLAGQVNLGSVNDFRIWAVHFLMRKFEVRLFAIVPSILRFVCRFLVING